MTEKGKMLRGMIYDPDNDPHLIKKRQNCKELCRDYNDLRPIDMSSRNEMLHRILGNIGGDNCVIGAGSVVVKDIPTNSVAVGNPCRVVKSIHE